MSIEDLIPVTIKMQTANNDKIHIMGATILRLSGKSRKGEEHFTRQIVYVTDSTDKLFLSRKACVDLGSIPNTFPTKAGPADHISAVDKNRNASALNGQSHLQCLHPYHIQPQNREKLQQYLLDYYSSSTFNTCEYQALPLI